MFTNKADAPKVDEHSIMVLRTGKVQRFQTTTELCKHIMASSESDDQRQRGVHESSYSKNESMRIRVLSWNIDGLDSPTAEKRTLNICETNLKIIAIYKCSYSKVCMIEISPSWRLADNLCL
eukprot:XP_019921567.1 PREDICTED: uncharacterized protein LOC109618389 [Crassostrea gigas]